MSSILHIGIALVPNKQNHAALSRVVTERFKRLHPHYFNGVEQKYDTFAIVQCDTPYLYFSERCIFCNAKAGQREVIRVVAYAEGKGNNKVSAVAHNTCAESALKKEKK